MDTKMLFHTAVPVQRRYIPPCGHRDCVKLRIDVCRAGSHPCCLLPSSSTSTAFSSASLPDSPHSYATAHSLLLVSAFRLPFPHESAVLSRHTECVRRSSCSASQTMTNARRSEADMVEGERTEDCGRGEGGTEGDGMGRSERMGDGQRAWSTPYMPGRHCPHASIVLVPLMAGW